MEIIKAPANNRRWHPPRFVMERASKASWTGMLSSAMILFSLCGSITLSRRHHSFPETNKRNGYPPS
jgi:hypothetical protein